MRAYLIVLTRLMEMSQYSIVQYSQYSGDNMIYEPGFLPWLSCLVRVLHNILLSSDPCIVYTLPSTNTEHIRGYHNSVGQAILIWSQLKPDP